MRGQGPSQLVVMRADELESLVTRAVERALATTQRSEPHSVADLLSVAEAAETLRCSTRKIRRLIAAGQLRSAKLGHGGSARVLIRRASVEALIAEALV